MSSTADLTEHISQLLDTYIGKFNRGDYDGAASNYHEPSTAVSSGGVTVYKVRQDFIATISSTVDRLRKDGWDHSAWGAPKKIIVLDEKGLVLASCPCKRLRKDGTSCEEFTAAYTLRKVDDRWLIVAIHHLPYGSTLSISAA